MPWPAPCVPCLATLLPLATFAALLRQLQLDLREVLAHAMLTILGYLLPRPDPAAENQLRAAFAEFDRELAGILDDRSGRRLAPAAAISRR